MTEAERAIAFEREQRRLLRAQVALVRDTDAEIRRLLAEAQARIRVILAGAPSDYQQWQLTELNREIERVLESYRAQASSVLDAAAHKSWANGIALTDGPLAAAGLHLAGVVPQISTAQLDAMRSFMTDRIKGITLDTVNRINSEIGLTMIGAQSPGDAVTHVTALLEEQTRQRAITVVRDNLGRAYSISSQARTMAAHNNGILMDKVWRRSGKLHQRVGHALADGQRVAADEPFRIPDKDGMIVLMMYPRDPAAPIGETINCGCVSIPKPRDWKSSMPDHAPFTATELQGNPQLAMIIKRAA